MNNRELVIEAFKHFQREMFTAFPEIMMNPWKILVINNKFANSYFHYIDAFLSYLVSKNEKLVIQNFNLVNYIMEILEDYVVYLEQSEVGNDFIPGWKEKMQQAQELLKQIKENQMVKID